MSVSEIGFNGQEMHPVGVVTETVAQGFQVGAQGGLEGIAAGDYPRGPTSYGGHAGQRRPRIPLNISMPG